MASIGNYYLTNPRIVQNKEGDYRDVFDVFYKGSLVSRWDESTNDDEAFVKDEIHYQRMTILAVVVSRDFPFLYPDEVLKLVAKADSFFYFTPFEFIMALKYLSLMENAHERMKNTNQQLVYCAIHKYNYHQVIYIENLTDSKIGCLDDWYVISNYDILDRVDYDEE